MLLEVSSLGQRNILKLAICCEDWIDCYEYLSQDRVKIVQILFLIQPILISTDGMNHFLARF